MINSAVFKHFFSICQIPHGSGNEKMLSDFIFKWANEKGLVAIQDQYANVLIRKSATTGLEDAPTVMLQAHLDMVCEKAEEVEHDFETDAIPYFLDGDVLSTRGRTTLGADNGIGVALAMALLEDETLQHPELEVLFTTMEEEDLSGVANFDGSQMKAQYLINLDHINEKELLCGSCGGMQVDLRIPVVSEQVSSTWRPYRLHIFGLSGGHSGDDIHLGRGNANIVLARAMMAIEEVCDFRIHKIKGGSFRLAIPREAESVLLFEPIFFEVVQEKMFYVEHFIREELCKTADNVHIVIEEVTQQQTWRGVKPEAVLDVMTLVPDGVFQMNEMLVGQVDTSDNLGEVYLNEKELHLVLEIRSAKTSSRTYLFQRMKRLAKLFGGTCESSNQYPSWEFQAVSPLRTLCQEVYEKMYGEQPKILTVHAGLEVGYFFEKKPEIDAVSIGPNCWNLHAPTECVSVSSVHRVYEYLKELLKHVGKKG